MVQIVIWVAGEPLIHIYQTYRPIGTVTDTCTPWDAARRGDKRIVVVAMHSSATTAKIGGRPRARDASVGARAGNRELSERPIGLEAVSVQMLKFRPLAAA